MFLLSVHFTAHDVQKSTQIKLHKQYTYKLLIHS
jgi:hypothetical protein